MDAGSGSTGEAAGDPVGVRAEEGLREWRGLLLAGVGGAWVSVVLLVVQVGVFAARRPPTSAAGFLDLFARDPLLGLVSLDALYVVNNLAVLVLYLALGAALWRASRSAVLVAVVSSGLGMAAYLASARAVEMLALAHRAASAPPVGREVFVAQADLLLDAWQGTAFDTYYVLNAAGLLLLAWTMRRSPVFSSATARWGLAAGALMVVPSTAPGVGVVFALASLVPWTVFAVLVARTLGRAAGGWSPGRPRRG